MTTNLTPPALADAASDLQEALDDCAEQDITVLKLALDVDDWAWLADALRDARDGLDCTPKLAQFAEQLHAALKPGGLP